MYINPKFLTNKEIYARIKLQLIMANYIITRPSVLTCMRKHKTKSQAAHNGFTILHSAKSLHKQ